MSAFDGAGPVAAVPRQQGTLRCPGPVGEDGQRLGCGRLLAELITAPFRLSCPRCKSTISG